jgi:hypothetical protein
VLIPTDTHMTAADAREHLDLLFEERRLALECGLGDDAHYMADLHDEIAVCRAAWVGAAVTEIATLRGQLDGPLLG